LRGPWTGFGGVDKQGPGGTHVRGFRRPRFPGDRVAPVFRGVEVGAGIGSRPAWSGRSVQKRGLFGGAFLRQDTGWPAGFMISRRFPRPAVPTAGRSKTPGVAPLLLGREDRIRRWARQGRRRWSVITAPVRAATVGPGPTRGQTFGHGPGFARGRRAGGQECRSCVLDQGGGGGTRAD